MNPKSDCYNRIAMVAAARTCAWVAVVVITGIYVESHFPPTPTEYVRLAWALLAALVIVYGLEAAAGEFRNRSELDEIRDGNARESGNGKPESTGNPSAGNRTILTTLCLIQGRALKDLQTVEDRTRRSLILNTVLVLVSSVLILGAGVALIFQGLAAPSAEGTWMGAVGVAALFANFFVNPLNRIRGAAVDEAQATMIMRSWVMSLNLLLLAMDVGGIPGAKGEAAEANGTGDPDRQTRSRRSVKSTALLIGRTCMEHVRLLQSEVQESGHAVPTEAPEGGREPSDEGDAAKTEESKKNAPGKDKEQIKKTQDVVAKGVVPAQIDGRV